MPANSEKEHLSIVICGHVDSGKSTTTGRLIFELGGLPERELEKLKAEAERLGKGSFAFAFYMDRQKEERERGVTIACTTKEFYTEKWHYTIIDAPGHRDFIKNMITGASQADVALIMVPADGNFTTAIAKGNHKAGEIQGQTRQHSRLINLLGVKQICIGVNKMDCDTAAYKQARYDEIANEMKSMLVKVGWKKDFIEKNTPVLPISGWMGDNLLKKSDNMGWWKGQDIEYGKETIHVDTVYDVLDKLCRVPERPISAPMRMPISGIYKIKGVGDVLAGRVEQGVVKPGEEVVFLPTHTTSNPCTGKVFTVEMHHQRVDFANPGDNVGLNIKGLDKNNMPRSGDVMVYKKDTTLGQTREFDAQIQVLDIPNEIKVGYSPIGFVRCGRSACRISKLKWKMGKETGGKKILARLPYANRAKGNEVGPTGPGPPCRLSTSANRKQTHTQQWDRAMCRFRCSGTEPSGRAWHAAETRSQQGEDSGLSGLLATARPASPARTHAHRWWPAGERPPVCTPTITPTARWWPAGERPPVTAPTATSTSSTTTRYTTTPLSRPTPFTPRQHDDAHAHTHHDATTQTNPTHSSTHTETQTDLEPPRPIAAAAAQAAPPSAAEPKSIFAPPGTTYNTPFSFDALKPTEPTDSIAQVMPSPSPISSPPTGTSGEICRPGSSTDPLPKPLLADFLVKPLNTLADFDAWDKACTEADGDDDSPLLPPRRDVWDEVYEGDDDDMEGLIPVPWEPGDKFREAVVEEDGVRGKVTAKLFHPDLEEVVYHCDFTDGGECDVSEDELKEMLVSTRRGGRGRRGRR